jgi:hypothetical protein
MTTLPPINLRLGALALATSALLFAVFPLVRPFFPLDVFSPTLAAIASRPLASPPWVIAHLLLTGAFALLPVGLLGLYLSLAAGPAGARALRGLVLAVLGIGLVVPAVGVETFAMPVLGRLYLEGVTGVSPALAWIYRGPMTLVMLPGLALLAAGAIDLARAIGRDGTLPRWAAITLATGLSLWLPLLPRPVRVLDGLLIGLGGLALAGSLWSGRTTAAEASLGSCPLPGRRDLRRHA